MNYSRPKKRSMTLGGHRTSVALEEEFWVQLRVIANASGRTIDQLINQIDAARDSNSGLATEIRVFILRHLKNKRNRSQN